MDSSRQQDVVEGVRLLLHHHICGTEEIISEERFSSNSDADASKLLEKMKKCFVLNKCLRICHQTPPSLCKG